MFQKSINFIRFHPKPFDISGSVAQISAHKGQLIPETWKMLNSAQLNEKLATIRLLATDVDGVLTDGGLLLGGNDEIKRFDSRDGAGMKLLMHAGIEVAIITGRKSDSVTRRAAELGIEHVYQGSIEKLPLLEELVAKLGVGMEQVAYVGDDLPDLRPMKAAGIGIAVADAAEDVINNADYVTSKPGGRAAVREVAEMILKAQGKWQDIVAKFQ